MGLYEWIAQPTESSTLLDGVTAGGHMACAKGLVHLRRRIETPAVGSLACVVSGPCGSRRGVPVEGERGLVPPGASYAARRAAIISRTVGM